MPLNFDFDPHALFQALTKVLPAHAIVRDPGECWVYGSDNSRIHHPPDVVVFPSSDQDVAHVLKICHALGVPVTARGRATATTGAAVPIAGGVVLSFERMDRLLDLNLPNRTLTAQAGILNQGIQTALKPHGFFWPPDPSSSAYCTLGGNIACNAGGPKAVRYGTTRDHVLGLTAVTAQGRIFKTGGPVTKLSSGYDLTRLIIGSEGTLAIVTSAILKITPLPLQSRAIQLAYGSLSGAAEAITSLMQLQMPPTMLEFMDDGAVSLIGPHLTAPLPLGTQALLLLNAQGSPAELPDQIAHFKTASAHPDRLMFSSAEDEAKNQEIWKARQVLSQSLRQIAPQKINEDVVVPIQNIPSLLSFIQMLSKQYGFPIVNFGHAGNGNIHVNLLIDPSLPGMENRSQACLDDLFSQVVALNGSVSGEHGVGLVKKKYLVQSLDPVTLDVMKQIKRSLDPKGILNPGKLWDD